MVEITTTAQTASFELNSETLIISNKVPGQPNRERRPTLMRLKQAARPSRPNEKGGWIAPAAPFISAEVETLTRRLLPAAWR